MTIVYIIIGLAILFVALVASRPTQFSVSRSSSISAPAEAVFAQINNLHHWEAWSPWAKLDPKATMSYAGPDAGEGASYSWSGNMKIGQGRMTIIETRVNEMVRIKLEFEKPMKGTNLAEFALESSGGPTRVTWSMTGKNSFMAKLVGLFMNCEKMCGGMFEQGLANLKTVSEAAVPA